MKKINILISSILVESSLLGISVPLASIAKTKEIKPITTSSENETQSIFNVKDGVLLGFNSNVTKQDLLNNMQGNTLVLPECNEIGANAFKDTILNDAPFGTVIVIPETTTTINDFAFYGNTASSITWSGTPTCTTIGKSAFARCSNLTTITFPSTITSIGASAFMGCSSLVTFNCTALSSCPSLGNKSVFRGTNASGSLTLTDGNAESIWMNFVDAGLNSSWTQKNSSGGTISKPKTIPTDYLTYSTVTNEDGNSTLTITGVNTSVCDITKFNKLVIPAKINNINVTAIGDSAFASKTSLKTVDLSSATNLTTIGAQSFMGSTAITSVTLSTSITTIGAFAFAPNAEGLTTVSQTALTTVTVPSGSNLATVDVSAFNSTSLSTFNFQNTKLKTAGSRCFRRTNLTSVKLPSTLENTSSSIFPSCLKLKTLDLSACTKVTQITDYYANGCSALTTIKFPSSLTTISSAKAFTGDSALTYVSFADTSKSFTVKNDSTVVDSSYMPMSPYLNAEYLRNNYVFSSNKFSFTYSYLNVDNAYKSTFTIPYKTSYSSLTWTSSDTSIATVSSGKVTVLKDATGSSTITAKYNGTAVGTCTINAVATNTKLTYTALTTTTASVAEDTTTRPTGTITIPAVWNSRFVTTAADYAFGSNTHIDSGTTYNFPATLTSVGIAFCKNTTVKYVNWQEPCNLKLTNISFCYDTKKLTKVTFPKGMASIDYALHFRKKADTDTSLLTTIIVPNTVGYIEGNWFDDDAVWGSGSLTLDLSELTHVPTLNQSFGSSTTASMTIKVKDADMQAKFQAATNWNDSRYTYTY